MTTLDIDLQKDVIDELAADPTLDATDIGVVVKGDVIRLIGSVRTFAEKQAAERAAKRVRGVHGVADELQIELAAFHRRTDADIVAAALHGLAWDVTIPDNAITVTVNNGWLTLEGKVAWHFQWESAARTVARLTGVLGVTNNIIVEPAPSPGDVKSKIRAAFQRSAVLDANSLDVELRDQTVVLRGPVHSWSERDRAARAAYSVPGVTNVENRTYFVGR
jgi:osmotically-inducible protein OsmY